MSLATVILAAGKGKRMKSDLPKVLHPLNNRAMIHYVIDAATEIHSDKIVLVVGHKKDMVMQETRERQVEYAEQNEQLGTGHAVLQTAPLFNKFKGDILVLSGDVPLLTAGTLNEIIQLHRKEKPLATLLTAAMNDPTGYGRVIRDRNGFVNQIVEEKDASPDVKKIKEINVGIYIFDAESLFATLPRVNNDNKQGEYYLPDVIKIYVEEGKKVAAVKTSNVAETHGINDVEQLKNAEEILRSRK